MLVVHQSGEEDVNCFPSGSTNSKYHKRPVVWVNYTRARLVEVVHMKCRPSEQIYFCCCSLSRCPFRPNSRATLSAVWNSWTTPSQATRSTLPRLTTRFPALSDAWTTTSASRTTTPCPDHSKVCVNWTARAGTLQFLSSTDLALCLFKLFSSRWVPI